MPLNEWRGDATPQAQVSKVSFANAESGDTFGIEINGKQILVSATGEVESDVADDMVVAIDESTIPEFAELSATSSGGAVYLTANTAGYPFEVSAFTINSTTGVTMVIAVDTAGIESVNEVQQLSIDGSYSTTAPGTFTLDHGTFTGGPTSAIDADATAAELKTEIVATFAEVSTTDLDVSGGGLGGPWFITWKGSFAESEVGEFTVDGSSLSPTELSVNVDTTVNGYGGADTVYICGTVGVDYQAGTFSLLVSGQETGPLNFDATPSAVQTELEGLSSVGVGNVAVSGYVSAHTQYPGAVYMIRFVEDFAGTNVTLTRDALGLAYTGTFQKLIEGGAASWPEIQVIDYGGTAATPDGSSDRWTISHVGTTLTNQAFSTLGYFDTTTNNYFQLDYSSGAYNANGVRYVQGDAESFDLSQMGGLNGINGGSDIYAREMVSGSGAIWIWDGAADTGIDWDQVQLTAPGVSQALDHDPVITTVIDGGSGSASEVQEIDVEGSGGTWTLSLDGETTANIAYGASTAAVKSAIEAAFTTVITVTVSGTGTFVDPYVVTFTDPGSANLSEMTGDGASLTGGSGACFEVTSHIVGVNEVQTITMDPSVSGGTFVLGYNGDLTGDIAYDASSAVIEAALAALDSIGTPTSPNVSVTGSAGGPWSVEFIGSLGKRDTILLGFNDDNLTGGLGTQTATITRTVESLGPNHINDNLNWSLGRVPNWADDVVFESQAISAFYNGEWVAEFEAVVNTGVAAFTIPEHSFNNNNQVVRLFTTGTLPAGLSTGTDYYVIYLDKDSISLSETEDGSGIVVTDAGTGTHTIEVHVNLIKTHNRYTGEIGLSEWNDNEYVEYRPMYFKVGILDSGDKKVLVGVGEGAGQPRFKLNLADSQANIKVLSTGGSQESGVPTMLILTNHASTNLEIIDGDVGVAFHEGETSTFNRLTLRGGGARLGSVTFSELDHTGGEFAADNATLNGVMNVNG